MDCEPYPDEMFEEAERRENEMKLIERYNEYYNDECAASPSRNPLTMEQQQMITLQSSVDAIRCEYLNQEYTHIAISDIDDLIEALYQQGKDYPQEAIEKRNKTIEKRKKTQISMKNLKKIKE
jgi:hypothetical protein